MKSALENIIILASLGCPLHAASACSVPDVTVNSIRSIIDAHGGLPITDAQCTILHEKHLAISIDGESTVLNGVNVGWAVVHLVNSNGVASNQFAMNTVVLSF